MLQAPSKAAPWSDAKGKEIEAGMNKSVANQPHPAIIHIPTRSALLIGQKVGP
jgi:hypothetical protein